jgi:malonate-semialdehyde dehydrogenase (acetylating) / methylmalonate-semialdehyde dehydrogenase
MIPLWMFPMALATGNTMLLKPSERDPTTAMMLVQLAQDAGVPDGVVNVVHGSVDSKAACLSRFPVLAIVMVSWIPFHSRVFLIARWFLVAVNFLCDDHNVRAISFVGSDRAGRHIYHRGTGNGKRVQVSINIPLGFFWCLTCRLVDISFLTSRGACG